MTTVMSWGNSEGTKGRCDAKCHTAEKPDCDCMCGGRYHGAANKEGGLERAVREHGEEVLTAAKERARREGLELQWADPRTLLAALTTPAPTQPALPGLAARSPARRAGGGDA